MQDARIFFFDLSVEGEIPGVSSSIPFSLFPFAGIFSVIDFSFFSFAEKRRDQVKIFAQLNKLKTLEQMLEPYGLQSEQFYPLEISVRDFIVILKEDMKKTCIIHNTGSCYIPAVRDLTSLLHLDRSSLHHLLINHYPVDTYVTSSEYFISILDHSMDTMETVTLKDGLFSDILPAAADTMENMEGMLLFNRNIKQFYDWHINHIDTNLTGIAANIRDSLSVVHPGGDSCIAATGSVIDSFISPDCSIHGAVIHSIIFPGVHVEEDCCIKNSVIMNDSIIGKGASIENTLIMPHHRDAGQHNSVGDHTVIGKVDSKVKNRLYPDQVYDGLTVIGSHGKVGDRTVIEPGCIIDTDISANSRKYGKKITRGSCVTSLREQS